MICFAGSFQLAKRMKFEGNSLEFNSQMVYTKLPESRQVKLNLSASVNSYTK